MAISTLIKIATQIILTGKAEQWCKMTLVTKPLILGLCTANRCRSQMFEAIVRHLAKGKVDVLSAGTTATFVHPLAIKVLAELTIPCEKQLSKRISQLNEARDLLEFEDQNGKKNSIKLSKVTHCITLCGSAKESCPTFPARVKHLHWPIDDPDQYKGAEAKILPHFRASRDDIYQRVEKLLVELIPARY